jgi:hypothetical protein
MASIEEQWPKGTPERAVSDAFSAFRCRDVARLIAVATPASIRALAARVGPELEASDSRGPTSSTGDLTDSEAASILERIVARFPEFFADKVRCTIVGHVLESRLAYDATRDGRGFIWLECRVTGAADEWISVDGDLQAHREIANRVAGLAHVVCSLDLEFPGQDITPLSPLEIATTQLVGGEWKLILDAESEPGLPGFRGLGFWIDPVSTTEAASDE